MVFERNTVLNIEGRKILTHNLISSYLHTLSTRRLPLQNSVHLHDKS